MIFCHQEEVRCWAGKSKIIYIFVYVSICIYFCIHGKVLLPYLLYSSVIGLLPQPGTPELFIASNTWHMLPPSPGPLPERLDHSHPLALSSNNPFSEASLVIHPSGLP